MMKMILDKRLKRLGLALAILAVIGLTGCGKKGSPQEIHDCCDCLAYAVLVPGVEGYVDDKRCLEGRDPESAKSQCIAALNKDTEISVESPSCLGSHCSGSCWFMDD